ncbi:hypothetical protein Tco_1527284, partial [Tanacetum coccineum]
VELHEAYAVSLFIGGLKNEVSMPIRMFKITTLAEVYAMEKMQEATNAMLKPRYTPPLLSSPKFVPNSANKTVNAPLKSVTVNGRNQIVARNGGNRPYRLTQKELEEKRAKNQCFYVTPPFLHIAAKANLGYYFLDTTIIIIENDSKETFVQKIRYHSFKIRVLQRHVLKSRNIKCE